MNKTTKKLLGLTTAAALCLSQISAFAEPSTDKVILNGNEITDISLEKIDGRNLMPLRAISELIGSSVYWFGNDRTIQIVSKDKTIKYAYGDNTFSIYVFENGAMQLFRTINIPNNIGPQEINDKTYIPLRAALASLLIDNPNDITDESILSDIPDKFTYNDGNINIT